MPTPSPAESTSSTPVASRFEQSLQDARRLRTVAEAHEPPTNQPFDDKAAALAYIQRDVSVWVRTRRSASERAEAAYNAALELASGEQAPIAWLESGALWLSFADLVVETTVRAAPPEIRRSPALLQTFREAALSTVEPIYARAGARLTRCTALVACRELLARVPRATSSPADAPNPWKDERLVAPERPTITTKSVRACSYSGTLRARSIALFPSATSKNNLATFHRVDVADVTLAPEAGRVLAKLDWPIVGELWLDARAMPFALRKKHEIVPRHIWLEPGTPVQARLDGAGSARVSRRAPPGTAPPVDFSIPCGDLALSGSIEPPPAAAPNKVIGRVAIKGPATLHSRPGGPEVGTLGEDVRVNLMARKGSWFQVAARASSTDPAWDGYVPFDFSAWLTSSAGTAGEGVLGALVAADDRQPTHRTKRELKLFTAPNDSAPNMTLARDVPLLAGANHDGFVAVKIPDVYPDVGTSFWVREAALIGSAAAIAR